MVDETLRDGLQSPSVIDPAVDRKIEMLHAMAALGVDVVSVGLPAAGARAERDAVALATEIRRSRLAVQPTAAGRTTERDVEAIARVSEQVGAPIVVYAFLGASPIRQFVEGWDLSFLIGCVRTAGETARRCGLPLRLVFEDTTRTPPTTLATLFGAAIDAGATGLCLCDTVGHASPDGVAALVAFARAHLAELGAERTELDWHGHNDRGLALGNALAAVRAGVDRVHGTALGIGERTGNVRIDHLLVALGETGARGPAPTEDIARYNRLAAEVLRWAYPAPAPRAPSEPSGAGAASVVRLVVNGDRVERAVRPNRTLLELLREDLDLIGTKQGCDKGDCGACTVLVDGAPVLSCLTLAAECDGKRVTTVESLPGAPKLDPLLDAFDRLGAGQCGFCTPGMLMTARGLLARKPRPTRDEIRRSISGNLCRCTGYGPIVDAIELAGRIAAGEELAGVDLPGRHLGEPFPPYEGSKP